MGKVIDAAGIQFRMLNRTKGPAMHSPRAQADKKLYQFTMKHRVEDQANLTLRQELVEAILIENNRVVGVKARGDTTYRARAVILTTGTFLKALMHMGEAKTRGGRAGDQSAEVAQRQPERVRHPARPLQDRHALPAQWPNHRLREMRIAARRRRAAPVQLCDRAHHAAADALPYHVHEREGARADPREPAAGADVLGADPEPGAALLSVDRGQGRALRGQGPASNFPGAGRPQHLGILLQWHLDQLAERRAGGDAAEHSRGWKTRR